MIMLHKLNFRARESESKLNLNRLKNQFKCQDRMDQIKIKSIMIIVYSNSSSSSNNNNNNSSNNSSNSSSNNLSNNCNKVKLLTMNKIKFKEFKNNKLNIRQINKIYEMLY